MKLQHLFFMAALQMLMIFTVRGRWNESAQADLYRAASLKSSSSAKECIKYGAFYWFPRAIDGQTALHIAADYGQDIFMDKLLTQTKYPTTLSNFVNAVDKYGKNALHYAILYAISPKHDPVTPKRHLPLKALLKHKEILHLNQADYNIVTPLHIACYHDDLETARILIQNGASFDIRDIKGMTAEDIAIQHKNENLVGLINLARHLLFFNSVTTGNIDEVMNHLSPEGNARIDVLFSNQKGQTALHLAAETTKTGKEDVWANVLKLLINKGAKINTVDKAGQTPMHLACMAGAVQNIEVLLKNDADVAIEHMIAFRDSTNH